MKRSVSVRLSAALCVLAMVAAAAPGGALAGGSSGTATSTTPTPTTPTTGTPTTTTPTSTSPTSTSPTATTPTSTASTPSAGPPVGAGPLVLQLEGLFTIHGERVTVPGRGVVLGGTLAPFVPGQKIELVASVAGHVFRRTQLLVVRRGLEGHFRTTLRSPRAGTVRIRLYHPANSLMLGVERRVSFQALEDRVTVGATGRFVQLIQQRLSALHLYMPLSGVYDLGTQLAVDAYHRLLGEGEGHTLLDPATLTDLLNGTGSFHVRHPDHGQHAEGDLSDQVLAFINGSSVQWLFPISSGKPSTPTILGDFQVYRKQPDFTPDGMYFSAFFHGGYAIHGYDPAPDYPASHGCMRLPVADAIPAYNWIQVGDWVDTYFT